MKKNQEPKTDDNKMCPKCFDNNDGKLVAMDKLTGFHQDRYVQDMVYCSECGHMEKDARARMS